MATPGVTSPARVNPEIVNYTYPAGVGTRRLSGGDFTIDSTVLIGLKYKDCFIILFYTQNEESIKLVRMWSRLATTVAGPTFATCNVLVEDGVAKAFAAVKGDGNHPLHSYGIHQWPVIIAYRGGFPQAVYNSQIKSDQQIANWSMTMACNARYFEPIQIHGGITLDEKGETIVSPEPYIDTRMKVSSVYFDGKPENEVRRPMPSTATSPGITQTQRTQINPNIPRASAPLAPQ